MYIINLKKTWEKLLLAARAICAVENPADVCVISARPYGQRGVLKFAAHTGATAVDGRFTPGTFTNQIQSAFREPRLLIVTDSRLDHQAIMEASYVNIPVIAFCNTDSPLKLVDIAIPCNNKGTRSLGLMLWLLAREVLIMQGKTSRELNKPTVFNLDNKEIMVDLYFYRDPEEISKQEQPREVPEKEEEPTYNEQQTWGQELGAGAPGVQNWSGDAIAAPMPSALGGPADFGTVQNWAMETQNAVAADQWQPQPAPTGAAPISEWGGAQSDWK